MTCEDRQIFENYVNFVTQYMNHDADPQIDFIEYACGNYPESDTYRSEKKFGWVDFPEAIAFMLQDESISNPVLEKVRNFHRSKEALLQGGMKEFLKSEQFIEFCGGIPVFNDNWSAENFNLAKALGLINALGLGLYSITLPKVKYDIRSFRSDEIVTRSIYIYRGHMDFMISEDFDESLAKLDLNDEELADVTNDFNLVKECYSSASLDGEPEVRFWSDMESIELFDLKEFIETACCINIQDHDLIAFNRGVLPYFEILGSCNRKTLANYIGVFTACEIEHKFTVLSDFLTYFTPALISVGFETYLNEKENEKLQLMIDVFKASYEKIEDEFSPNTRETRMFLFGTDIDRLREDIAENYNPTKIRAEYEDLQISPNNFFQNMINIRNHGIIDSHVRHNSLDDETIKRNRSLEELLGYVAQHYKEPLIYHFSVSLPSHFWIRAINGRYVDGSGRLVAEDLEDNNIFHNPENDKFKIPEETLRSQIAYREDWASDFFPSNSITHLEVLTYAYKDYRLWMEQNKSTVRWQDEILSKFNLDCKKLFFVGYAIEEQSSGGDLISALMNFVDFINAFDIGPDSPMNPRRFISTN